MPWDLIDEKYAKNFEGSENGNVAVSSLVAFGALVIKQELNLSDEEYRDDDSRKWHYYLSWRR